MESPKTFPSAHIPTTEQAALQSVGTVARRTLKLPRAEMRPKEKRIDEGNSAQSVGRKDDNCNMPSQPPMKVVAAPKSASRQ